MIITDSIEIKAPPERIFSFLTDLKDDASYKAWHPDHVVMRWIKGEPFQEGSVVYFEEYLHGKIHKGKFICTKVVPNRLIEYKPPFPLSVFFPKNQFIIGSIKAFPEHRLDELFYFSLFYSESGIFVITRDS